jgi:hypothetical protein
MLEHIAKAFAALYRNSNEKKENVTLIEMTY